jgi:hypothetical protein
MKHAISIYSKFKKWILFISILYLVLLVSSTYLLTYHLKLNTDRHLLGNIGTALTLGIIFLFPILTFKHKVTEELEEIKKSPWLFGIIVNLPIISLGFLTSLLDLALRIYWLPNNYWSNHQPQYFILLMIGAIFYIALSSFAGWLASATNATKKTW